MNFSDYFWRRGSQTKLIRVVTCPEALHHVVAAAAWIVSYDESMEEVHLLRRASVRLCMLPAELQLFSSSCRRLHVHELIISMAICFRFCFGSVSAAVTNEYWFCFEFWICLLAWLFITFHFNDATLPCGDFGKIHFCAIERLSIKKIANSRIATRHRHRCYSPRPQVKFTVRFFLVSSPIKVFLVMVVLCLMSNGG